MNNRTITPGKLYKAKDSYSLQAKGRNYVTVTGEIVMVGELTWVTSLTGKPAFSFPVISGRGTIYELERILPSSWFVWFTEVT